MTCIFGKYQNIGWENKKSIQAIWVNTNEEQIEEEVVVTRAKQVEKKIEKTKAIYNKMEEKEIDKPSQVSEFQLSLAIPIAMSGVGKKWEDVVDQFLVTIKTTWDQEIQQQNRYTQQLEENKKMKKQIKELQKDIEDQHA